MIYIESDYKIPKELIEQAAQSALRHQSESIDADMTIVLTDDVYLHELNRDYLGVDAPTDVLSFPASETDPETGSRYMGDILISVPYADRSAQIAGHPLENEVQLLVVHGVLHLFGHDHAEADQKERMWKAQREILGTLGLDNIQIRED